MAKRFTARVVSRDNNGSRESSPMKKKIAKWNPISKGFNSNSKILKA